MIDTLILNMAAPLSILSRGRQLRGGAIFNEGGIFDFNSGSLFEENMASDDIGGFGGAIFNRDGGVVT